MKTVGLLGKQTKVRDKDLEYTTFVRDKYTEDNGRMMR